MDFNGNSAVTKLCSLVDEALLAKRKDKDNLVAIQEGIARYLDVCSALFGIS